MRYAWACEGENVTLIGGSSVARPQFPYQNNLLKNLTLSNSGYSDILSFCLRLTFVFVFAFSGI
jgi:hypothetical protein